MRLLLAILFLPLAAFGQAYTFSDQAWLGNASPVSTAGCSGTTILTNNAYNSANIRLGGEAGTVWLSTWFVPETNMTVVTIAPYIRGVTTSPTYNFRAAIYTSDANTNPTTLVGSWSSYMPGNYVSLTTWGYTNMPGNVCASLVAGTKYFVVLNSDAIDANGVLWGYNSAILPNRGSLKDADGAGTWSVSVATAMHGFRLLGGP